MTLHTEKYKQAILYLCAKLGKERYEERKNLRNYSISLILIF